MMLASIEDVAGILVCPRCHGALSRRDGAFVCSVLACPLSSQAFPDLAGQPALVDFDNSVLDPLSFVESAGASYKQRGHQRLAEIVLGLAFGRNRVAEAKVSEFLACLLSLDRRARLLIIGGGVVGNGAEALYANPHVDVIGTDIYVSANTTLIADAHHLPFASQSIDGVWIQAVLEHVLDPHQVVGEIHRVLRHGGVVFADTPFMQQVHERAYDFTRFTLSGYRWLFRHFTLIKARTSGGAGTATPWSLRYLVRAITRSGPLGTLLQIAFFWLRLADRVADAKGNSDAASAVYFYGQRSETPISPREIIAFYQTQKRPP